MNPRQQITIKEFDLCVEIARVPQDCEWNLDPAATSDRMRLSGPGIVLAVAYPGGRWFLQMENNLLKAEGEQRSLVSATMALSLLYQEQMDFTEAIERVRRLKPELF